jgi:menaquinone-dependent protoporphyrinogen oxidase
MKVLVVYGTTEGQTRKIAEYIAQFLRDAGHEVALQDAAGLPTDFSLGDVGAVLVGASVHQGQHQAAIRHFVKAHHEALRGRPSGFFSVSLTAIFSDAEHDAQSRKYVDEFCAETGWSPGVTARVAGALRYSQYDFFKRFVMKLIAREEGGDTDTSRDYEYTDWNAVREFVREVMAQARTKAAD